jgi:hypothetical protein
MKLSDHERVMLIEIALRFDGLEGATTDDRKGLCLLLKTVDLRDFCQSIRVMQRCAGTPNLN